MCVCVCVCATKQKTFVKKTQTAKKQWKCSMYLQYKKTQTQTQKIRQIFLKSERSGGEYEEWVERGGDVGWIEVGPERGRS